MKISRIKVYAVPLPYKTLGRSRVATPEITLHDTVVEIETDEGVVGWGESCPLAPMYLPATPGGLLAALDILGPALISHDPRNVGELNGIMDSTMLGHGYAKAALDMACWDILGAFTGLPLKTLLGGARMESARVYDSIPMDTPDSMIETVRHRRSIGIGVFQVKMGEGAEQDIERLRKISEILEPGETVICGANRGWTMDDARRFAMAADAIDPALDIYVEQPCATYDECLKVRKDCRRPMVLDEVVDDMCDLIRAIGDGALDALVIKLSHAGGLSKAREMAVTAIRSGIKVRIEDTVGAEFVRAAVAHMAMTVPSEMLLATYPHPAQVNLGQGEAEVRNGQLFAGDGAGLGVEPDLAQLGEPVSVYE